MTLSRTSAPASRQLPISNQRDEEFAYPVAPPFNWRDGGGSQLGENAETPSDVLVEVSRSCGFVGEIISDTQVSFGFRTIADD
jgi:hypothetical protein